MVGKWRCNGACTDDEDVSVLGKNTDGSFYWVDGVGRQGVAEVSNVDITVTFGNGSQLSGVIRANCHQIHWWNNHDDTKETN
jgi:hypothetical protein